MSVTITQPIADVIKQQASVPVVAATKIPLELHLYTTYQRHGTTYIKGTVYQFTREQAIELLQEQDAGRSIWKRAQLRPAEEVRVKVVRQPMVDMSARELKPNKAADELQAILEPEAKLIPIEIGDDNELEAALAVNSGATNFI